MREQHFSSGLQNRVLHFFDYLWIRNKGAGRQSLLEDMPSCMQAEVSLATTERLIKQACHSLSLSLSLSIHSHVLSFLTGPDL